MRKQNKNHSDRFKHTHTYLGIFRHIQECSKIILAYWGIFRILCNPNIFRTLVYSRSETEAYSEPCQTSMMEHFAKIVNSCSIFCKLFLQYQLFTFCTFFNKSLFATPKVFILYKKVKWPTDLGAVNFIIPTLCHNFLFIITS